MARSCFFLAKGMADGSLGKEIQLKSILDGVVFCHPIFPGEPYFRAYHVNIKENPSCLETRAQGAK